MRLADSDLKIEQYRRNLTSTYHLPIFKKRFTSNKPYIAFSMNLMTLKSLAVSTGIVASLLFMLVGCGSRSVRFATQASHACQLFIDAKGYGTVAAGKVAHLSVDAGTHLLKTVQATGFVSVATEYTKNGTTAKGESV